MEGLPESFLEKAPRNRDWDSVLTVQQTTVPSKASAVSPVSVTPSGVYETIRSPAAHLDGDIHARVAVAVFHRRHDCRARAGAQASVSPLRAPTRAS